MQPSRVLFQRIAVLVANDVTKFRDPVADSVSIHAVKALFTPSPNLVIGDLTLETLALENVNTFMMTESAQVSFDANNGDAIIWANWKQDGQQIRTGGIFTPFTLFGYALVGETNAVLWATEALEAPINFTDVNQLYSDVKAELRLPIAMVR